MTNPNPPKLNKRLGRNTRNPHGPAWKHLRETKLNSNWRSMKVGDLAVVLEALPEYARLYQRLPDEWLVKFESGDVSLSKCSATAFGWKSRNKASGTRGPSRDELETVNWQDDVLERLAALTPDEFERLVGFLMGELGVFDIEVVGRSSDGGIDGHGRPERQTAVPAVPGATARRRARMDRPGCELAQGLRLDSSELQARREDRRAGRLGRVQTTSHLTR